MRVLHVTPELAPFDRGGIADGVAGLAKALAGMGDQVTVALPRFVETARDSVTEGSDAALPGVRLLFFEIEGDPKLGTWGTDVLDLSNARRFGRFARAVTEHAAEAYDLVHVHDWPTAIIPYLLRARGARARAVLTIHNLAFQGIFPREALALLGLGDEHFTMDRLEFFGHVNLLKGGIVGADAVTTVSPTYAGEIQTEARGDLLDGVLAHHAQKLVGIVNGIDYDVWDPERDAALPERFSAEAPEPGRASSRRAMSEELALPPGAPLVVSLGRLVDQKGTDVLAAALPGIVALEGGPVVAIAGAGDPELAEVLEARARELSLGPRGAAGAGRVAFLGRVDDRAVHRLMAAADLVVMPSRWEPCGIVQMQGQRYGALPVARRTGGLADTIADGETGFLYDGEPDDPRALVSAVARALAARREWPRMRRRAMALDLSWRPPALAYRQLYFKVLTIASALQP